MPGGDGGSEWTGEGFFGENQESLNDGLPDVFQGGLAIVPLTDATRQGRAVDGIASVRFSLEDDSKFLGVGWQGATRRYWLLPESRLEIQYGV